MKTRFWTGGAKDGWWVKITRQPDYYPGKPQDFTIKVFHSKDFANGEDGAAIAANALCESLNDVLDEDQDQPGT